MRPNLVTLDVKPGINKDDTDFKTRQGGYVSVNNMRPRDGAMEAIGGWEALDSSTLTGVCRGQFGWTDNNGRRNVAFGTHSKLYVWRGGSYFDITPSSGFTAGLESGTGGLGYGTGTYGSGTYGSGATGDDFPLTWTFGNYGEWLIACARGQGIYVWKNDTAVVAAAVTNAPTENTAVLVFDRQIMAIGTLEETAGTFNPRCIRWCDIGDIEDWTTASDNNAGEYILQGGGLALRGVMVGPGGLILTDRGVVVVTFIGDPAKTFDFRELGNGHGLIGPNAVTVMGQTAFWVGQDFKFRVAGVGQEPQVLPSTLDQDFEDAQIYAQREKIYAGTIEQYGEVFWFYPHKDDGGECSRYVAFSVPERAWFEGVLARTAFGDVGIPQYPVIGVNPSGKAFIHEQGINANGDVLNVSGKTGDIYISDSDRVVMLRSMRPDLKDQEGVVFMKVCTKATPQGAETEHGPYTLRNTTEKVDFRASGAIVQLEFYSEDNRAKWRLGRPVFDVTTRGRR